MKKLIFLFLTLSTSLNAQNNNWATDSLDIYEKKIDKALDQKKYEEALDLFLRVSREGDKSLHPSIYASMEAATGDERVKLQPEVLGRLYNYLGNFNYYKGNYENAKTYFRLAMAEYKKAKLDKDEIGMAMNLGILLEKAAEYDSAIASYQDALKIFKKLNDTASVAVAYVNIGLAYSYIGSVDTSLDYYNIADSVYSAYTQKFADRKINLWYNMGRAYLQLNNYEKAVEYTFKGLRLSDELEDSRLINIGYRFLEGIYEGVDNEKWYEYILLTREFAEKVNNKDMIAQSSYSLARYYSKADKIDSAQYYAYLGLDHFKVHDSMQGLFDGYIIIGNIEFQNENFSNAIEHYQVAIDNLPGDKTPISLSHAYHNIGASYTELKAYDRAEKYLLRSLDIRKEKGELSNLKDTYESLAFLSEKRRSFESAFYYQQKSNQYKDSIFNDLKSKQITEIQTEYETEKKDQSITNLKQENEIQELQSARQKEQIYLILAVLMLVLVIAFIFYNRYRQKNKDNKLLQLKNEQITIQDKEKEVLLKEIHHRVKNNLQIISSLLSMQSRSLSDSKVIDAVKESQSRVRTMALIHEKLYQYNDLARINMNEYMRELGDFLVQTYRSEKEIKISVEIEDISLDIDTAVPLGLIANELLSNALKYAFDDVNNGEIKIILLKNLDGECKLVISDTGKGLQKELNIETVRSLGLKLVHTLTRQIKGNLTISSNMGTSFAIEFNDSQMVA